MQNFWITEGLTEQCKEPTCQGRRQKRRGFDPWVGKIPWRRAWQPSLVFLPVESRGQRNLVDYSPRGSQRTGHDQGTNTSPFFPVFLPGKSQGQRSLVGYSTRSHDESKSTERVSPLTGPRKLDLLPCCRVSVLYNYVILTLIDISFSIPHSL